MRFNYLITIIISFVLFFVSCEANIDLHNISDDVALNPSLIVPLGGANLTLSDMLSFYNGAGNIATDGTEIYFQKYDTIDFNFPELNLLSKTIPFSKVFPISSQNIIIPANTSLPLDTVKENLDLGLNHNPETELIDSILIDQAVFSISLNQTNIGIPAKNVNMSILFPQIKMLNPLELNVINFIPTAYGVYKEVTLKNFMLYTKGKSDFPTYFQIKLKTGSNPVLLTSASNYQLQINITKMAYKIAYGYLEPFTNATRVEQVVINLNKNLPSGVLKYSNPQIEIKTNTNIGTYLIFKVNYVKAFSTQNPVPIYAKFDGKDSATVEFKNKPTILNPSVINDIRTLDKDWGQTYRLFENEIKPDILEYKFSVSANKTLIQSEKSTNYITPDAAIKVYVRTKIPFQFNYGSYFEYKDSVENIFKTISSEINKYPQDKINTSALVLNVNNGLPVTTKLILNLIDSLGQELTTDLKKDYIILAGKVDNDGIVQPGNETKQNVTISLTNDQLNTLSKARKIKYTVRVEGENFATSNIHFTENNIFSIKFGFFVKGSLNSKVAL